MLSIMFMQNLYNKFYDKKKRIIPTSNKTLNSSTKQHATRQNLEHAIFERFKFIRNLSSKSIAQGLIIEQQRHIKSIKHGALSDIRIDDIRRHIMLSIDLAIVVKTFAQYRTCDISRRKSHQVMRRLNKV